jgi:glutaminyl-tRNA synthetase
MQCHGWEDRLLHPTTDQPDPRRQDGKAFVCDLSAEEVRATRGTLTEPGTESPYRNRSVEENLDLFERMRAGQFPDGARTLRAKIDMASTNLNLRDPIMYRIVHASHHRTGDKWCIYPMYDWAHGQSDSIEGITHSICTLEFEDHRPLYDWYLDSLGVYHPQQIEFARLHHTLMSKRHRAAVRAGFIPDGMTPACPPSVHCAGEAIRRKPSAISASGSGSPRPTRRCRLVCSSTASARI